MGKYYVLYNPLSGNNNSTSDYEKVKDYQFEKELELLDITKVDYSELIGKADSDDGIVICGGDGTLNRFINDTYDMDIKCDVLYFACGSGNDFSRDLGKSKCEKPYSIKRYIRNLPAVTVKGKTYRFLNNVGFGIDGYCTKVGDEMRRAGKENINYAGIAIKGMLGAFRPVGATVTVDGHTETYKNVWLAPAMKGRFYGGGMMPTPAQDRNAEDGSVSVMIFHERSKLKTLTIFPSIFQGEHVNHTKQITVLKGHNIAVTFDKPCPLQIDGETILDVTSYTVAAETPAKSEKELSAAGSVL